MIHFYFVLYENSLFFSLEPESRDPKAFFPNSQREENKNVDQKEMKIGRRERKIISLFRLVDL